MFDPLVQLSWRIADTPFDEAARLEVESILRSRSPNAPELRFLELERQLGATADGTEQSSLLRTLRDLTSSQFSWDDRRFLEIMPRRFNLWLDYCATALALAMTKALRCVCDVTKDLQDMVTPFIIEHNDRSLQLDAIRQGLIYFICRYEHRSQCDPPAVSPEEVKITLRPAWH